MRGHQPTTGTGVPSQTPDQVTSGRRSTVPERDSGLARITALEARLAALEARLVVLESYHQITDRRMSGPKIIVQGDALQRDCGCPANNYVCGNAACPRALRVTCAVSTKEIEN